MILKAFFITVAVMLWLGTLFLLASMSGVLGLFALIFSGVLAVMILHETVWSK